MASMTRIDPARVSLREIKPTTVRTITALAVSAEQRRFVATNAESLAEALFHPEAWYRAIYVDDTPAGFVMLYDESLRPAWFTERLAKDHQPKDSS